MIPDDIRLVIFDADGTLRVRKDGQDKAPLNHNDWEIRRNMATAIHNELKWRPVVFGIASNQACVGRGEVNHETAYTMLEILGVELTLYLRPESIQMCPHTPEVRCECRKPQPKMLNDIMDFWGILPKETLFIGDAESDRLAAENAGCHFLYVQHFLGKE